MKRILLLSILAAVTLAAADNDHSDWLTKGALNGYAWEGALGSHDRKVCYVSGMLDTYLMWDTESSKASDVGRLTRGETADQIDIFYKDAANGRVPVFLSLIWVHARVGGASPQDLEDIAALLRRSAATDTAPAGTAAKAPAKAPVKGVGI